VTDATSCLQVLNPRALLGGAMAISQDAARAAIEKLAARLDMDVLTTAQGIVSVVTANMAKAIRVISVQRGHDPRDYTLVAFGGAGPLHAARLARELDVPRVLVPKTPGLLCALGLLLTDLRTNYSMTRLLPLRRKSAPAMAGPSRCSSARAEDGSRARRSRPTRGCSAARSTCATPGRTTS
jgi:N-methylhydantoinase A